MNLEEEEERADTTSTAISKNYSHLGEDNFENVDRLHQLYQKLYDEFVKSMKSEKFYSPPKDIKD